MNLEDCQTLDQLIEVFFEWDGPKTNSVTLVSAKLLADYWGKRMALDGAQKALKAVQLELHTFADTAYTEKLNQDIVRSAAAWVDENVKVEDVVK